MQLRPGSYEFYRCRTGEQLKREPFWNHLSRAGRKVTLWSRDPAISGAIATERANPVYLPGIALEAGIEAAASLDGLGGCDVLLLVYVSGLLAIGFSPIVRLIERQTVLPIGSKRFPRWLAILILYLVIIGAVFLVGSLIFPPLVRQGQSLWSQLPDMFEKGQQFLMNHGNSGAAKPNLAGIGRIQAGDNSHQCGFTRAVFAG